MAENTEQKLIGTVVMVVIAAVMYVALLGPYIADLTNVTGPNWVGASLDPIVGIVPIFYWLAVALTVIGIAMATFKFGKK